jgi:hypothetical protein
MSIFASIGADLHDDSDTYVDVAHSGNGGAVRIGVWPAHLLNTRTPSFPYGILPVAHLTPAQAREVAARLIRAAEIGEA